MISLCDSQSYDVFKVTVNYILLAGIVNQPICYIINDIIIMLIMIKTLNEGISLKDVQKLLHSIYAKLQITRLKNVEMSLYINKKINNELITLNINTLIK